MDWAICSRQLNPSATINVIGLAAFTAYVYERDNPCGWHLEWWLHVGGCRKLLKVVRHTLSHEIHVVGGPEDQLSLPPGLTR